MKLNKKESLLCLWAIRTAIEYESTVIDDHTNSHTNLPIKGYAPVVLRCNSSIKQLRNLREKIKKQIRELFP